MQNTYKISFGKSVVTDAFYDLEACGRMILIWIW